MSNYFTSVGTKSSIKTAGEVIRAEECRFDLMLELYESKPSPMDANVEGSVRIFEEWCELLFNNRNILVHGRLSKMRFLDTFRKVYLESGMIPDYDSKSTTTNLNIATVRLHGLNPISMEKFQHAVFKYQGSISEVATEQQKRLFIHKLEKTRIHYVFVIHSFDLLYEDRQSRRICDLIFQLYSLNPDYIHIIMSTDHLNSGKYTNKLRFPLNLVSYNIPYGESFFYEREMNVPVCDDNTERTTIGGDIFNLKSLLEIYQAMQKVCQTIMIYIIRFKLEEHEKTVNIKKIPKKRRKIDDDQERKDEPKEYLKFEDLYKYCESNCLLRRSNALKNHLGELVDHRVVEMDPANLKISCLVEVDTCKKFLETLDSQAQE